MPAVQRWDPSHGPLQLSTLRHVLQREGMVTAWWSDLPGTRVPEHMHDFPETRWVLAGFLKVTTPEGAYELGPGDRLDLPAETRHACEVVGLSPAIYVTGTSDQRAAPAFAITNT